jgi:NMT1-like family
MIHRPNEIEAAVFLVGLDSIAVKELAKLGGFTFLAVDRAKAIDLRYEYLREAIIPKAIYESRELFPNNDVKTVSSATILACHGKMEKDSVREILKSLHEHHRDMAVALQRPPIADPQDPQKSFLYPLHSAALEFYKNESPPPLFTLSILLSLAGLILGQIAYFRTFILKRRIRSITDRLEGIYGGLTENRTQTSDFRDDLEKIKREALLLYAAGKIDENGYKQIVVLLSECEKIVGNGFR